MEGFDEPTRRTVFKPKRDFTTRKITSGNNNIGNVANPFKEATPSVMVKRFAFYGTIYRLCGCLFICNLRGETLETAQTSWKTLYSVYSAFCFTFYVVFQSVFVIPSAYLSAEANAFSISLHLLLHAVVVLKFAVNFISLACGSSKLLDFFRKAAVFEKTSEYSPCKTCSTAKRRRSMVRGIVVFLASASYYVIVARALVVRTRKHLPSRWGPVVVVLGSVVDAFFLVCDSLPYVVLRCTCEVLVDYIHAQVEAFQGCCDVSLLDVEGARTNMETADRVRLNMGTIRELKTAMNDIWQLALVVAGGAILLVTCGVLTVALEHGLFDAEALAGVAYAIYSSLNFLELAVTSQAIKDEVSLSPISSSFRVPSLVRDGGERKCMVSSKRVYLPRVRRGS